MERWLHILMMKDRKATHIEHTHNTLHNILCMYTVFYYYKHMYTQSIKIHHTYMVGNI